LGPIIATSLAINHHWSYGFLIPGCICMSVGYLSIIILRNRPSDVYLVDFDADSPTYRVNENTFKRKGESEYEIRDNYENDDEANDDLDNENKEYDEDGYEIEHLDENEYASETFEQGGENENYLTQNEPVVNECNPEFDNLLQAENDIIQNEAENQGLENEDVAAASENENEQLDANAEPINEEIEISRMRRIRMLFSHWFFISICLAYFFVSLIRTIFSDWSQLYLRRNIKVDPYDGIFFKCNSSLK